MKGSTAEDGKQKLADLIEVPTDKLTDRDKKIIGLLCEEAKEKLRIKIVKSLKIKN